MIAFDLECSQGHIFEGWFNNIESFEEQNAEGLVSCPYCDDTKIRKVLSPVTMKTSNKIEDGNEMKSIDYQKLAMEIVDYINKNFEDVGMNSRYLFNELNYKFSSLYNLTVETKIQTRDITQSNINLHNHRKELNFANRVALRYGTKNLSSGFIFSTSQLTTLSSRRPVGSNQTRSDIDGLQTAFHLFFRLKKKFDESRISFSYTKYEYSSPDTSQTAEGHNHENTEKGLPTAVRRYIVTGCQQNTTHTHKGRRQPEGVVEHFLNGNSDDFGPGHPIEQYVAFEWRRISRIRRAQK